jgi:hypothetical protein
MAASPKPLYTPTKLDEPIEIVVDENMFFK